MGLGSTTDHYTILLPYASPWLFSIRDYEYVHRLNTEYRACIVANVTFGLIVIAMLVIAAATGDGISNGGAFAWSMRLGVVVGYVLVGLHYTKLWHIYSDGLQWDVNQDGVEDDCSVHIQHCSICRAFFPAFFALAICGFIFWYQPYAVWNALSG